MEHMHPLDRAVDCSSDENKKTVLAIDPHLGSIYRCRGCRSIHLRIGGHDFCMDGEAFAALASMVFRAAANGAGATWHPSIEGTVQ